MIRFLILGAIAFVVYKLFFGSKKKEKRATGEIKDSIEDMVKDPVCGTYIPANTDIRVREGDKVYYFCSYECRDKFLKMRAHEKSH